MDIRNLSWERLTEFNNCLVIEIYKRLGQRYIRSVKSLYLISLEKYISTLSKQEIIDYLNGIKGEFKKRRQKWCDVFNEQYSDRFKSDEQKTVHLDEQKTVHLDEQKTVHLKAEYLFIPSKNYHSFLLCFKVNQQNYYLEVRTDLCLYINDLSACDYRYYYYDSIFDILELNKDLDLCECIKKYCEFPIDKYCNEPFIQCRIYDLKYKT